MTLHVYLHGICPNICLSVDVSAKNHLVFSKKLLLDPDAYAFLLHEQPHREFSAILGHVEVVF